MTVMAAAMMLLCAGACRSDRGYEPDPDDVAEGRPIYLTLNVACADPFYPSTRADDAYYFEDAQSKYEKIDHLRVIITDPQGKVVHNRLVGYYNDGTIKNDNLIFKVDAGDYHVHLFANERSLPKDVQDLLVNAIEESVYPETELSGIELSRDAASPLFDLKEYIPMTESFDISLEIPLVEIDRYKTINLFVTRVPVKFTFGLREDPGSLTLKLRKIATRQYFLPHDLSYSPAKANPATEGRTITSYGVPENAAAEEFLFTFDKLEKRVLGDDNTEYFVTDPIYLCETKTADSSYEICIKICDAKDDLPEVWSEWKPLPNLPDLPRNTHAIVRMANSAELNLEVTLMPYIGCTLDPWFGLEDKKDENKTDEDKPSTDD